MNALELLKQKEPDPSSLAFHQPGEIIWNFGELFALTAAAQTGLRKYGVKTGDTVLFADQISVEMYASVLAMLGMGVTVMLVEPFLPVKEIEKIIQKTKPKLFIASTLGKFWGARVSAIRKINHWCTARSLCSFTEKEPFRVESLNPTHPGIMTFTSGTTGTSKAVIRTHQSLTEQNRVLYESIGFSHYPGTDLTIFANLVFANIATGRGSVFIGPKWKYNSLLKVQTLPQELQPETLSCGPGFIRHLLKNEKLKLASLKSIHVGGAQTDCQIFQNAFQRWGNARFLHIYGSSEAEPVAVSDARQAVEKSLARGYFQTLSVGGPIPHIESRIEITGEQQGLWVKGPHVGPHWHFMGDRILEDSQGWWYQGRSQQDPDNFILEQSIYSSLQSSASFVHQGTILVGEKLKANEAKIKSTFPQIKKIVETKIIRDRRHHARIDRVKSLKAGKIS